MRGGYGADGAGPEESHGNERAGAPTGWGSWGCADFLPGSIVTGQGATIVN